MLKLLGITFLGFTAILAFLLLNKFGNISHAPVQTVILLIGTLITGTIFVSIGELLERKDK